MPASTLIYTGGSTTFVSLKGQVQPLQQVIEEITRPGIDGHAYRKLGKRAAPFAMIGIRDCDDLVAGRDLLLKLATVQGDMVTITDDYNHTLDSAACLEVARLDLRPVLTAAGGLSANKGALLVVRFVFHAA